MEEARKVAAGHGWMWLKQGIWLFRKSPLLWMVLTSICVVGLVGISTFPMIGDSLSTLLFPGFFAGLMAGCHALANDEELELAHLFSGFQKHAVPLVTLGGISLVGQLAILGLMTLLGGGDLVNLMMSGKQVDSPEVLAQAVADAGGALYIGMFLFFVLLMGLQLAPLLVMYREMAPFAAVQHSLRAFLRNALPMALYGAIVFPLMVLATLPMMLGWLLLLPVLITSTYAVYRDLFPMPGDVVMRPDEGAQDDQPMA